MSAETKQIPAVLVYSGFYSHQKLRLVSINILRYELIHPIKRFALREMNANDRQLSSGDESTVTNMCVKI